MGEIKYQKDKFGDDILKWPLANYGTIIRGNEETSEDQVAQAISSKMAERIVACVNFCQRIKTIDLILENYKIVSKK